MTNFRKPETLDKRKSLNLFLQPHHFFQNFTLLYTFLFVDDSFFFDPFFSSLSQKLRGITCELFLLILHKLNFQKKKKEEKKENSTSLA